MDAEKFKNWYQSLYKKQYPLDLATLKKYADKSKIDWITFACEAIVTSVNFRKTFMDNNNPFCLMSIPVGDKNSEIEKFRSLENGIALAASTYRGKSFSRQAVALAESARKFAETGIIVQPVQQPTADPFKEPGSGFNDKGAGAETDKLVLHLPKIDNPKKVALWLSLVGGIVGVTSIFVPQLKPVSLLLTAIKELLKNHKKENIKKEK